MTYPLQQFDFDKSAYERPTQPWVCGWSEEGRPCQIGPDRRGRCRATFHCQPIKKGDRWQCTRSPNYGGPCEQGPMPDGTCSRPIPKCQPVRSMRARRMLAVRLTIALTVALLVVVILGPFGEDFISPGPLTAAHATTAESCRSCHSVAQGAAASWIAAAWQPHSAGDDAELCLNCHKAPEAVRLVAGSPHSMPLAELRQLRNPSIESEASASHSVPWRLAAAEKLVGDEALMSGDAACSTCHREHHGRNHQLAGLDNEQCQACHSVKFASFVEGHPEFSDTYPQSRRARIAFNHAEHARRLGKPEELGVPSPIACTDCHSLDPTHRHMILRGFDASCASCHSDELRGSGGVAFLQLPTIDVQTLRDSGFWIGKPDGRSWPQLLYDISMDENKGDVFYLKSRLMKLLLCGDEDDRVGQAVALLDEKKVQLDDLSGADPPTLEAAARVLWSIKVLAHELAADVRQTVKKRLERALPGSISENQLAALFGQLPDATRQAEQTLEWNVRRGVELWMSGMDDDVREYLSHPERLTEHVGQPVSPPEPAKADDVAPASDEPGDAKQGSSSDSSQTMIALTEQAGGWCLDVAGFALAYKPVRHADPFVKGWLDAACSTASARYPAIALSILEELRDPAKGPVRCGKCHSVDSLGSGRFAVNWRGQRPESPEHTLTNFAHGPHFNRVELRNCQACHDYRQGVSNAKWKEAYKDTDPKRFTPDIAQIKRSLCVECHTPRGAGDSCLMCHRYHRAELAATPVSARLTEHRSAGETKELSAPAVPSTPASPVGK